MDMKKVVASLVACGVIGVTSLSATVYAEVNGQKITDEDIGVLMRAMPGTKFGALPQDAQKKVLDQAIDRVLLTGYAEKSGIEKTKDYKEGLDKLKQDLALEVWMQKQLKDTKVPESEVKKFYEDNKDKFKRPEIIRARHILVKDKGDAEEIIDTLEKTPKGEKRTEEFIDISSKKSIDKAAAKNGGELGWFDKNQMVPEFTKAAFSLKPGEISKKPVKTQFGYHVIMVEEEKSASTVSFAEAKQNIEERLKVEKFREDVSKKAESLRKSAKIKYLD